MERTKGGTCGRITRGSHIAALFELRTYIFNKRTMYLYKMYLYKHMTSIVTEIGYFCLG